MYRILVSLLAGLALTLTSASLSAAEEGAEQSKPTRSPDVVYVPTPNDVVAKMLELAKVKKGDVVYDLGCGDGRIVVTAAKKYGAKGIGFDINPQRIKESLENVRKNGVGHLVEIKEEDIFEVDLSKASVITLYLLPEMNARLIPQFDKMKPGSRIVSHAYDMDDKTKPDKRITVRSREDNVDHTVRLYTVPLKKVKDKAKKGKGKKVKKKK